MIMNILKVKSILFSLVAVLMVAVFMTSCEQGKLEQSLITDYKKGEKVLGDYIIEQNGSFVLTEKDPYKLGIEPQLFDELLEGFNEMNRLVKEGEIKPEWINKVLDMETMEEITITDRCNEDKIVYGYSSIDIYFSTDTASWMSWAGCYVVSKVRGDAAGLACAALIQSMNQHVCPCGYFYSKGYGFHWTTSGCQGMEGWFP